MVIALHGYCLGLAGSIAVTFLYTFSIKILVLDLHQSQRLAAIDQQRHIEISVILKRAQNL